MELNESGQEITVLIDRIQRLTDGLSGRPVRVDSLQERDLYKASLNNTNAPAEIQKSLDRLRALLRTFGLVE
jgi:hypothetical protein